MAGTEGGEWRYGDRLRARLRLAKDSPLRFEGGDLETSIPIDPESWAGALVAGAPSATLVVEAGVTGSSVAAGPLRVSATVRTIPRPPEHFRTVPPRLRLATTRPPDASGAPAARLP